MRWRSFCIWSSCPGFPFFKRLKASLLRNSIMQTVQKDSREKKHWYSLFLTVLCVHPPFMEAKWRKDHNNYYIVAYEKIPHCYRVALLIIKYLRTPLMGFNS